MKFARFTYKDEVQYGVVTKDDVSVIEGNIYGDWDYTGEVLPLEQVEVLAPVNPEKVIGIGANYVGSKEEKPEQLPEIPVFFFKPASSVVGSEAEIIIPGESMKSNLSLNWQLSLGRKLKTLRKMKYWIIFSVIRLETM